MPGLKAMADNAIDELVEHPLLYGLFLELPNPGITWSVYERDTWINAAKAIFDLVYEDTTPEEDEAAAGGLEPGVVEVHVPPESAHLYGIKLPSEVSIGPGSARSDSLTCPDCGKPFKRQGYAAHRTRIHGDAVHAGTRATPGERLAQRDAGRATTNGHRPTPKEIWERSHAATVPYPGDKAST